MPDDLKTGAAPGAAAAPQGSEPPKPTTATEVPPVATPNPQPPAEKTLSGNLKGVSERADGTLEVKVGSSVYVGKNLDELWENVTKGITSKDELIAAQRQKRATEAGKKFADTAHHKEDAEEPEEPLPDEQEIFEKNLSVAIKSVPGLKAEMLRWSNDQWKEHQRANELESWEIAELRQGAREVVQRARAATETTMNQSSTIALNRQTILQESKEAASMIEESGVGEQFTEEVFEECLRKAAKKTNKNGIITSGAITAEVGREVARILKEGKKSDLTKQLEEEAERGRKAKEKIPGSGGGSGAQTREPAKAPAKSYDEARKRILEEEAARS